MEANNPRSVLVGHHSLSVPEVLISLRDLDRDFPLHKGCVHAAFFALADDHGCHGYPQPQPQSVHRRIPSKSTGHHQVYCKYFPRFIAHFRMSPSVSS